MPDLKISQLPVATTPLAGTELVPIVQGGTTDQTTVEAILKGTVPSGTANGVLYLDGSKVVSSGSALTFDSALSRFSFDTNGTGGDFTIRAFGNVVGQIRTPVPYTDFWFNVPTGNAFAWAFNNSEAMRLNSTGLGIGTSNPLARVHTIGASGIFAEANAGGQLVQIGFRSSFPTIGYYTGLEFGYVTSAGFGGYSATMRLDSSGNMGLGVTPAAWTTASSTKAIEVGDYFLKLAGSSAFGGAVTNNAYYDGAWKRSQANLPSMYTQLGGVHSWHTAPSGAAGSTISFTQAMTLDASGNLGIGATSPARKLHIVDAAPLRMGQTADYFEFQQNNTNLWSWISNLSKIPLYMDGNSGSVIINDGSITTTATGGFLYVPGCAGTPTGTPTTYTGRVPIVVDTTNNKLYFYSGGQWRDAGP